MPLRPIADFVGGEANLVALLSSLEPEQLDAISDLIGKVRSAKADIAQDESTPKNPIHGENGSVEKNN